MQSIIDVKDVFLGYTKNSVILKNINIALKKGQFCLIVGKNGVGKTTLIKFLCMKLLPLKGEYFIFSEKVEKKNKMNIQRIRKKIGVIQQNNYLIPYLSVYQNVQIALEIQNEDKSKFFDKISQILNWVGIQHKMNQKVQILSSGEKQKVILARAVVSNPDLIIADEPTLNLDEKTKDKFLFLLKSLTRQGTTVVLTANNICTKDEGTIILNLDRHSKDD